MNRCPACGTSYTDATLKFCLADGARLEGVSGEKETVVRSGRDALRVDIPQDATPDRGPVYPPPVTSGGGGIVKILAVVVGLLFLVLLLLGGAGALFYYNMGPGNANTPANNGTPKTNGTATPTVTVSPTASPKDENAELRNQIANLERMINEQKNRPANSTLPPAPNDTRLGTTARVNSPGDGFLALRSYPSSDVGSRITTIPHGAEIAIGGCLAGTTRIGGKTGRWCRASYRGQTGWVFDAFLSY